MKERKYRIVHDSRRYGELEIEWRNGKRLILTESRTVHSNDYCSIKVWIVTYLDEDIEDAPEYMYEYSFMPDGYSLERAIVGE